MLWRFRITWWISRIFLTHVCNTHVQRADSRTSFFFNRVRLESWSDASLASGHVSCRSRVYVDTSNRIKSLTRIKVLHVNTDLILKSNFPGLYPSSLQHASPTSDTCRCVDVGVSTSGRWQIFTKRRNLWRAVNKSPDTVLFHHRSSGGIKGWVITYHFYCHSIYVVIV